MAQDRTQPFVSVIVPAMNSAKTIVECIESIKKCDYQNCEIIVVDGNSNDGTPRLAAACGVSVIEGNGKGRAGDLNLGVGKARGDIIAITDDDCIVDTRWLERLSECFKDQEVGVAGGPNLTRLEGNIVGESSGGHVHDFIRLMATRNQEDAIIGCNSAYRRAVLVELGGFREDVLFGGEDTEMHSRILNANRKIAYDASCVVYHKRRAGVKKVLRQFWLYGKGLGVLYHRNRRALPRRARQTFLATAGLIIFVTVAISSFFLPIMAWVLLFLVISYVLVVIVIHAYLVRRTGYASNITMFLFLSTASMLVFILSFAWEQVLPSKSKELIRTYSSRRGNSR